LIIGIASSLVATAIFILLSEFVRKIMLPWIADKVYRGVRIDGVWKLISDNGEASSKVVEFNLSQWGNKITGSYYHESEGEREHYKISGTVNDMYFMYTCEPVSNKQVDAAVGLFHIEDGDRGNRLNLNGALLFRGKSGEVNHWPALVYAQ
jgi:hypothetical protein